MRSKHPNKIFSLPGLRNAIFFSVRPKNREAVVDRIGKRSVRKIPRTVKPVFSLNICRKIVAQHLTAYRVNAMAPLYHRKLISNVIVDYLFKKGSYINIGVQCIVRFSKF